MRYASYIVISLSAIVLCGKQCFRHCGETKALYKSFATYESSKRPPTRQDLPVAQWLEDETGASRVIFS